MGADSLREFLTLGEGFNTQVVMVFQYILHKWRLLTGEVVRPMRCGETIQYGTGLQC